MGVARFALGRPYRRPVWLVREHCLHRESGSDASVCGIHRARQRSHRKLTARSWRWCAAICEEDAPGVLGYFPPVAHRTADVGGSALRTADERRKIASGYSTVKSPRPWAHPADIGSTSAATTAPTPRRVAPPTVLAAAISPLPKTRGVQSHGDSVIVESKAHLSFSPLQAVPPPVAVRSTTIVPVPSSRPSIPHPDRPRAKYVAGGHRPSTSTPPPPVPVLTRRLEFPQDPRAIFGRRTAGRPLGDSDSAASTKREMQRRTPGP